MAVNKSKARLRNVFPTEFCFLLEMHALSYFPKVKTSESSFICEYLYIKVKCMYTLADRIKRGRRSIQTCYLTFPSYVSLWSRT